MTARIFKELASDKSEPKIIGPLTLRQAICTAVSLPFIYLSVNYAIPVSEELGIFLIVLVIGIAYVFGWMKFYGLPIEKYLSKVLFIRYLAPQTRKYIVQSEIENNLSAGFKAVGEPITQHSHKKASSSKVTAYYKHLPPDAVR